MEMESRENFERPRGPQPEEMSAALNANAKMLAEAYQNNVKDILEGTSQQLGEKDSEGHKFHAQQMQRILNTLQDPRIKATEWPKNFELPGNIPIVFKDKEGRVQQAEINVRSFDNPKKFVDGVQEKLYGGGIA